MSTGGTRRKNKKSQDGLSQRSVADMFAATMSKRECKQSNDKEDSQGEDEGKQPNEKKLKVEQSTDEQNETKWSVCKISMADFTVLQDLTDYSYYFITSYCFSF